jgi:glycosyltransferase involved in cell wall biosynthesis
MVTAEGPMRCNFETSGRPNLKVVPIAGEQELEEFLYSGWSEVAHIHVPGYAIENAIYNIIERRGHRPFKVVETNVFGRLKDPRANQHTDARLFISMASGAQALKRSGIRHLSDLTIPHSVIYYPVDNPRSIDENERRLLRSELGLGENDILAVRTGRPDARKWGTWETAAFAAARKRNPHLFFLQMQPPDRLRNEIETGQWGPGFICLDMDKSQERIGKLCQSADLMLHAARSGESFGYSIAEGMAAGLPVVTLSTPWGDNAQVELVKHLETGFVCSTVSGLARAVLQLSRDSDLRRSLGATSRCRIRELAYPAEECRILSDLCAHGPSAPSIQHRSAEFRTFVEGFPLLEEDVLERGPGFGWLPRATGIVGSRLREGRAKLSDYKADLRTALGLTAYRH